jgi:hypothetical protein
LKFYFISAWCLIYFLVLWFCNISLSKFLSFLRGFTLNIRLGETLNTYAQRNLVIYIHFSSFFKKFRKIQTLFKHGKVKVEYRPHAKTTNSPHDFSISQAWFNIVKAIVKSIICEIVLWSSGQVRGQKRNLSEKNPISFQILLKLN